jgi:putative ABC transport system permease protein
MLLLRLIFKEMLHRPLNAGLALLAVTTAVALYTGFATTGAAADAETTRLMRDLGFNLRIIPAETDESEFFRQQYASETMPQEYVQRFTGRTDLSYRHLQVTLQRWVPLDGKEVLLKGIAPELSPQLDGGKKPMIFSVEPGTLYLGYHVAKRLGLRKGDSVTLLDQPFTVAQTLAEKGADEDVTVYAHLSDVQRLLHLEGRINEIKALECLCTDETVDSLDVLRAELAVLLPEAKVIMLRDIAEGREQQRLMILHYFDYMMSFILLVCALWIGVLAWINVRERRHEIGILRALGYGDSVVAGLFLAKAVLIGLLGALIGYAAGIAFAQWLGPVVFKITGAGLTPPPGLLQQALIAAPAFCALCSLLPALAAATQDPARVLREE